MSFEAYLVRTGIAFVLRSALTNTTRQRVIPPSNVANSHPCNRIRVLTPLLSCEPVSVRPERFLEETETCQSSKKLRLAGESGDIRTPEHDECSMFRTRRRVTGVMRRFEWRKTHRKGHWSGPLASCCGSTLQSEASESHGSHDGKEPESAKRDHHNPVLLGVNVNQQAELELLTDFWTGSTLDPAEADQMLVIFFNQSFSQGLKQWVREKALAALFLFARHLTKNGLVGMLWCWRCLDGWRNMISVTSKKKTHPYATWCALACLTIKRRLWRMAVALMIQLVL